jgi:hypothetical protein
MLDNDTRQSETSWVPPAREEGFYVYVYCDPRPGKDEQPIYVGKGVRYRVRAHWRRIEHHPNRMLRHVFGKISNAGLVPLVKIFGYMKDEDEAYRLEMGLIAKIGRRDLGTGSLCNLSSGGKGVSDSPATVAATRKRRADPELEMMRLQLRDLRKAERLAQKHAVDPELKKAKADRAREASGKRMREYHANPEFKAALRERNTNPERIAQLRAGWLKYFADPANIARRNLDLENGRASKARKRMAAKLADGGRAL